MYLDDEIIKRIENRVDGFVVCSDLNQIHTINQPNITIKPKPNQIHNLPKRNEVYEKNIEKSETQLHTDD